MLTTSTAFGRDSIWPQLIVLNYFIFSGYWKLNWEKVLWWKSSISKTNEIVKYSKCCEIIFIIFFIILSDKFLSKAPPTFFVWDISALVYLLYFDLNSLSITKVQSLQLFPLCFWNILTPFFLNMATPYLIFSVPSPKVCRFDQTVFATLLHPSLQIMLFSKFAKKLQIHRVYKLNQTAFDRWINALVARLFLAICYKNITNIERLKTFPFSSWEIFAPFILNFVAIYISNAQLMSRKPNWLHSFCER